MNDSRCMAEVWKGGEPDHRCIRTWRYTLLTAGAGGREVGHVCTQHAAMARTRGLWLLDSQGIRDYWSRQNVQVAV